MLSVVSGLIGCKNDDDTLPQCVRARYLGKTNSPCGGPDLIEIVEGQERIFTFYSYLAQAEEVRISTTVPEDLQIIGGEFYFIPKDAPPRICLALYIPLPEVELTNVSTLSCP